ncbi:MAG: sodium ion-translocating decarboxylase subunit beta [Victivallales bacterium]|nr:sodium ion-translocating decarboxylase subunit beta [Victivallales bacterium]MCF7889460.1 sodium ion-translocating decarboxylase subunit beta [Victivallales bacterium]
MRIIRILFIFFISLYSFSVLANESNGILLWEKTENNMQQLVYNYDKPATIYSITVNKDEQLLPGSKIMILSIPGRSKAHIKIAESAQVREIGKLNGKTIETADKIYKGQVLFTFEPKYIFHDSMSEEGGDLKEANLPSWGRMFSTFWRSTGVFDLYRATSDNFPSTWNLGIGKLVMIFVGLVLLYLAVFKEFEPLLLLPIGFGAIMSNIPLAGISGPGGLLGMVYAVGISTGVFPLIIFMGVGAMTDFGPLIANPKMAFLGASAQFGIFFALIGALLLSHVGINFSLYDAASIGIIGGADGPTAIFLTSKLSPRLLGAIAVAAYSYMALVPIIQPPIMKLFTSEKDRKIKMKQLRPVSKLEKVCFPIVITLLCALLLPAAAPLISMLMFGNLMKECGVVDRLNNTAQNALINTVTIFLGLGVGSKLSADNFLNYETLGILLLGMAAFCVGTGSGLIFGQIMKKLSKGKINPLIGAAGVSAVPMSSRVVNKVGLEADPHNFLLMHAMGPNVAGVIGSAVAAGVLLSFLS